MKAAAGGLAKEGKTVVYVPVDEQPLDALALADMVRGHQARGVGLRSRSHRGGVPRTPMAPRPALRAPVKQSS